MKLIMLSSLVAMSVPPLVFAISILTNMRSSYNNREKLSPFECGFDPLRSARTPFSMRFFLLAVIFLVFDIEIVLLIPIPLIMSKMPSDFLLISTMGFLLILILGLIYEWSDGSLEWNN